MSFRIRNGVLPKKVVETTEDESPRKSDDEEKVQSYHPKPRQIEGMKIRRTAGSITKKLEDGY